MVLKVNGYGMFFLKDNNAHQCQRRAKICLKLDEFFLQRKYQKILEISKTSFICIKNFFKKFLFFSFTKLFHRKREAYPPVKEHALKSEDQL